MDAKGILGRLAWMPKVRDCRHVCLFCGYYDACREDCGGEKKGRKRNMKMRYALRSEDTEQAAVISWAQWQQNRNPELKLLYHCPNGGSRNKAEAAKLKQMGVLAGVPDLHLPVPKGIYSGLYIEMKYGEGRLEKTQREFLTAAAGYGCYAVCCYGAEEAIGIIREYLNLGAEDAGKGENRMRVRNASILKEGQVKQL